VVVISLVMYFVYRAILLKRAEGSSAPPE